MKQKSTMKMKYRTCLLPNKPVQSFFGFSLAIQINVLFNGDKMAADIFDCISKQEHILIKSLYLNDNTNLQIILNTNLVIYKRSYFHYLFFDDTEM